MSTGTPEDLELPPEPSQKVSDTSDGSFGPPEEPAWILDHVFPYRVDPETAPVLETAAALCRFKKAAWHQISSSTVMFGAIEYTLRDERFSGPDADQNHPLYRLLNLLRTHGMIDGTGDAPYDRLKKSFFAEDLPAVLELRQADTADMTASRNMTLAMEHTFLGPRPAFGFLGQLLVIMCSDYLQAQRSDGKPSNLMNPDRFSFEMFLEGNFNAA